MIDAIDNWPNDDPVFDYNTEMHKADNYRWAGGAAASEWRKERLMDGAVDGIVARRRRRELAGIHHSRADGSRGRWSQCVWPEIVMKIRRLTSYSYRPFDDNQN